MASLKDVARVSGVSIATVSNVINKTKFVSDELIARVHSAIDELGYSTDLLAKSLKTGKSRIIAIMMPDLESPLCASMSAEIVRAALLKNLGVLTLDSAGNPEQEKRMLKSHLVSYCAGSIVMPLRMRHHELHKLHASIPRVTIQAKISNSNFSSVCYDVEAAIVETMRKLIDRGHTDIAFVANGDSLAKRWFNSYLTELGNAGINLQPDLIKTEGGSINGGFKAVSSLLVQEHKPSAILVANDLMTLGAIRAISINGLHLDEDVALAGITSEQLAYANPKVISMVVNTKAIADAAVELLSQQIDGSSVSTLIEVPMYIRHDAGSDEKCSNAHLEKAI